MFEKLNKKSNGAMMEGVKLEELDFIKLRDLIGKELAVKGYFFTEGQYGTQVVVVTDEYKVNMPERAVKIFEEINNDPEMRDAVLGGHLLITDIKEGKGKRGKFISFTLADR